MEKSKRGVPVVTLTIMLACCLAMVEGSQSSGNQNRKACLVKDAYGLCTRCNSEYHLEDNLCYLCSNACKRCADRHQCSACFSGYRIDQRGKCYWIIYDVVFFVSLAFVGLLAVAILGVALSGENKHLLIKTLVGDDFKMPAKTKAKSEPLQATSQQPPIDRETTAPSLMMHTESKSSLTSINKL